MKKTFFIPIVLLFLIGCSKHTLVQRDLTPEQKKEYLSKIEKDPLFIDYLNLTGNIYNQLNVMVYQSKIDTAKMREAATAKDYETWKIKVKAAGITDPDKAGETFNIGVNELKKVYKKYPLLQTQFSKEERNEFLQKTIANHFKI